MRYLLIICLLFFPVSASGFTWSEASKEKKVLFANAAGLTAITARGFSHGKRPKRTLFAGIGINLSRILNGFSLKMTVHPGPV
jgi:hypothetical protein